MDDVWKLDAYQKQFDAEILAMYMRQEGTESEIIDLLPNLYQETLRSLVDILFSDFDKRSPAMLKEHRTLRRGFVKRNVARWRRGFDLLERLIVISQESGAAVNGALRPKAAETGDALFEAVISNHARAVQLSREILALMTAGFPNGAMGRWRTLHEIAVVSMFIYHAGRDTAERDILHDHVTSYKRAKNYMEHHKRANLGPIEPEVMERLRAAHDEVIRTRGDNMKHDYGWAAPALNNPRPTFADLELATELDHWRPRYKWATTNTRGAYQTLNSTLATCEADQPVLAVGESNSGMTDPGHMTAISLNIATMPVMMLEPNLDRLAAFLVMQRLSDEIGDTLLRLDRETYERARKRRNAAAKR